MRSSPHLDAAHAGTSTPDGFPTAAPAPGTADATTDGALLGGRVSYRQFREGYRTGIEPVLLAAAVPATAGERVLEAGCGAGAGLLCLSSRIAGVAGAGIEQDPGTAALARHNLDANGLASWPVLVSPLQLAEAAAAADAPGGYDHAMANPPWHRSDGSASQQARRDLAKRAPAGTLLEWTASLVRLVRDGGTLTLILPSAQHAEGVSAMVDCGMGDIRLLPLWPMAGRAARIVLLQGVRAGRGDGLVLPGLVLHRAGGSYTEATEAILRDGAALAMDRRQNRQHPPA